MGKVHIKHHCDLCGYQFKVCEKEETNYYDREPYLETCYYICDSENAHSIGTMLVCDKCFKDINIKVKNKLIEDLKLFADNEADELKRQKKADYDKSIRRIDERIDMCNRIIQDVQCAKLFSELPEDEIKAFNEAGYLNPILPFSVVITNMKCIIEMEKKEKLQKQKQMEKDRKERELYERLKKKFEGVED